MTLRWKVWACARNGKKASRAAGSDGSRATGRKAQRGKAISLRLPSQEVAEKRCELKCG